MPPCSRYCNASMNTSVQISLQTLCFILEGTYPEVKWMDYTVVLLLMFEEHHILFHSGCPISHPHQQCTRLPSSPYPHCPLLEKVISFETRERQLCQGATMPCSSSHTVEKIPQSKRRKLGRVIGEPGRSVLVRTPRVVSSRKQSSF